ncbi:MAG: ATPase [Lachnospiraceae bacterium]|nr:ATPase [Lachnospiraceae bacterium]
MQSKIEQTIKDIEDYIDGCKGNVFNPNKITIDKQEMDELIEELKVNTPEEIKALRKIVSNKDAIINDAKKKAQALIDDAAARTNQMVSESEIMQQAYAQSEEVIRAASEQAQAILDNATAEANAIKEGAIAYTDDMMANVENILAQAMDSNAKKYEEQQKALEQYYNVLKSNRAELYPEKGSAPETVSDSTMVVPSSTGELNLDMI